MLTTGISLSSACSCSNTGETWKKVLEDRYSPSNTSLFATTSSL
jgi:hypothetical protein